MQIRHNKLDVDQPQAYGHLTSALQRKTQIATPPDEQTNLEVMETEQFQARLLS